MPQLHALIFDLEGTLLDSTLLKARLYPEAVATVARFHTLGLKIGLCTNRTTSSAQHLLEETGLAPYFHAVGGSDAFEGFKPDPRHALGVASLLGIEPAGCALVGDGANDIEAALGAGMTAIAIVHGSHAPPRAEPHAVIRHFNELPPALRKLGYLF